MDYKKIYQLFNCVLLALLVSTTNVQANPDQEQIIEADKELFAKAVKLSGQGLWLKAEPVYRDLIKRNKDWPEPKNNLAIVLLKTDRMDEAKLMFEQAVTSSPSFRIAQKNRSQLYNYLAAQAYEKALGSKPSLVVPEMTLIKTVELPVKIIQKTVEKTVEVIVEKPVIVEKVVEKVVERIVEKPVFMTAPPESSAVEKTTAGEHSGLKTVLNRDIGNSNISNSDISNSIEQQLIGWSRAWSQGDFDLYIKSYSDKFIPSDDRKTFAEWRNIRRGRLTYAKGVDVSFDQLRVFVESQGGFVLAEFIQYYKSASYSDKVLKQMYMQKEQNNWRILSERTIKTY